MKIKVFIELGNTVKEEIIDGGDYGLDSTCTEGEIDRCMNDAIENLISNHLSSGYEVLDYEDGNNGEDI